MPHFVNKTQHYFLSTNYKVLYSLLYHQPRLQVADKRRMALNSWLKQGTPLPWRRHFLLVRNPYQRLESFYKDKFRQELVRALSTYDKLQSCQRFFCPYLQIDPTDSPITIREKLLGLTFAQFIQILPSVYLLEGHLHPQVRVMTIPFRGGSIQLKFDKILKVESARDLAYLQDELGLDLSQRYNSTQQVDWPTRWQPNLRAIVNHLYEEDFAAFDYEVRTV